MAKRQPMRLREIRRLKGFRSQADLAKVAGVTQEAVSLWERGQKMPGLDTAVRVSQTLGITPQELYAYIELERAMRQRREESA